MMAIDVVECTGIDTVGEGGGRGDELCHLRRGGGSMVAAVTMAAVAAALVGSSGSGGHGRGGSRGDNGGSGKWQ
jgi:hypothetical protein